MEASMPFLLWGGLFVLTVLAEFATQQLVSIWFAAGALAGFLAACFGASPVVQIVLFVVISVVLLIFTRPIVRRIFSFGIKDTNNQEVGRIAVVIQTVDPIHNTGRVRLDGVDWIAVSQDGTVIPESTSVRIEAISGTKLLVSRLPQTEEQTVNN
ncbi:NfeD family protein [Ruminococcus sp.]